MIHKDSKAELDKHLFQGCGIIELGDQFCDWNAEVQGRRTDEYFIPLGYKILSIDWHGKNNALNFNLNDIIEENTFQADILTDFGTLEHVENLFHGLINCHNFTKINGIMIHVNPDKTYVNHGYRYFTERFWEELAAVFKYKIVSIYSLPPYEDSNPALEVYAVLQKTKDSVIPDEATFKKLIKYTGNNHGPETIKK